MFSIAVQRLSTIHGRHLTNAIEIINASPTKEKILLMQRLFIVSTVAFWESFHEDLCREGLTFHTNPPNTALRHIESFHNPNPKKIKQLYRRVLGIEDITESWWGNALQKSGPTPDEYRKKILRMITVRHDVAHGNWNLPLSSEQCQDAIGTVVHLAIRTDEAVQSHFQIPSSAVIISE